ncbi:GatB/YqeY domain-containing protein [Candidatus Nomurabacteria bacterium]|nr:GatB/YqeY domain-containing protein [Candidatus Nomurabacteria bacterium]
MTLHEQIKGEIKTAMMARDTVKLNVMRGLVTAFMNELVATGKTPQDLLSDEEALKVITRTAKQRKDAIEQFIKGGRQDLADEDTAQLKILEVYLPQMMSKDEVMNFARAKQTELSFTDVSKKGMFMATLMKDLKGKADGGTVKEVVDDLLK